MRIPIANAIAIDPDLISTLLYRIVSVRYFLAASKHRRRADPPQPAFPPPHTAAKLTKQQIADHFTLNATNGNLYAQHLPCSDCTVVIQYRASDVGLNRNRASRRSTIKLHVKHLPVSLFATTGHHLNPTIKTFDLHLRNTTRFTRTLLPPNTAHLTLAEDTKLGEKLFQITVEQSIALNQLAVI